MANDEHAALLKQGMEVWNKWRDKNPKVVPNLIEADLTKAILTGADLTGADLSGATLTGADLSGADLSGTILTGARLSGANLTEAILSGANLTGTILTGAHLSMAGLSGAHLSGANLAEAILSDADLTGAILTGAILFGALLYGANLTGADLSEADLTRAILIRANLTDADLTGADLTRANLSEADLSRAVLTVADLDETMFINVDLTKTKGLDQCRHLGPSAIDYRTLQQSGPLPLFFLRGAGLPDNMIEYLPSLLNQPIQFYSCFISYATADTDFAQRLYADLQNNHVRCWFAPEDLKIGNELRPTFDEAIRIRDKLLVVLSERSLQRPWVKREVEQALDEQMRRGVPVLFPVRLDDAIFDVRAGWATDVQRHHIGDFRQWKDHDAYQKALRRLLRDLKVESPDGEPAGPTRRS